MNQQDHDQRSLAWHRHVIARLRADQSLVDQAQKTLDHWIAIDPKSARAYLDEWSTAIDAGLDALAQLATAEDEHANALRQCSPLSCLLPRAESWAFRKNWNQEHATRRP